MDWKSRRVRTVLETALAEDKVAEDLTTSLTVNPRLRASGSIVAKQPCVVSGLGAIPVILDIYSALRIKAGAPSIGRFEVISHPEVFDSVRVKKGQTIAVIRSQATALLSTERAILNLIEHMSGISTLTNDFVKAVQGTGTRIVDTRKTLAGLRSLDKYAVCCGGGVNSRLDLHDGILIKHNHIALAGGIGPALTAALAGRSAKQWVQVEVHTPAELDEAMAAGAESFLLDHMTPAQVKRSVKLIRASLPEARIEASGGIAVATAREYALAGAQFLSIGLLTHSAPAADMHMKIAVDAS